MIVMIYIRFSEFKGDYYDYIKIKIMILIVLRIVIVGFLCSIKSNYERNFLIKKLNLYQV